MFNFQMMGCGSIKTTKSMSRLTQADDGEDVGGNVDQNHAPARPEEPVLLSVRDEYVDPFEKNGCFEENHE
ncbi:hypothetical protein Daus18300_001077 [Diaporthe australafricana]|uniref:Uncharacterized protein n=1 Tax=Diaporthe australafricana TaxID=127596 RepID=A0ABR3XYY7_9PEZI